MSSSITVAPTDLPRGTLFRRCVGKLRSWSEMTDEEQSQSRRLSATKGLWLPPECQFHSSAFSNARLLWDRSDGNIQVVARCSIREGSEITLPQPYSFGDDHPALWMM